MEHFFRRYGRTRPIARSGCGRPVLWALFGGCIFEPLNTPHRREKAYSGRAFLLLLLAEQEGANTRLIRAHIAPNSMRAFLRVSFSEFTAPLWCTPQLRNELSSPRQTAPSAVLTWQFARSHPAPFFPHVTLTLVTAPARLTLREFGVLAPDYDLIFLWCGRAWYPVPKKARPILAKGPLPRADLGPCRQAARASPASKPDP